MKIHNEIIPTDNLIVTLNEPNLNLWLRLVLLEEELEEANKEMRHISQFIKDPQKREDAVYKLQWLTKQYQDFITNVLSELRVNSLNIKNTGNIKEVVETYIDLINLIRTEKRDSYYKFIELFEIIRNLPYNLSKSYDNLNNFKECRVQNYKVSVANQVIYIKENKGKGNNMDSGDRVA